MNRTEELWIDPFDDMPIIRERVLGLVFNPFLKDYIGIVYCDTRTNHGGTWRLHEDNSTVWVKRWCYLPRMLQKIVITEEDYLP